MGVFEEHWLSLVSRMNQSEHLALVNRSLVFFTGAANNGTLSGMSRQSPNSSVESVFAQFRIVDLGGNRTETLYICPSFSCQLLTTLYIYGLSASGLALLLIFLGYAALIILCALMCQAFCLHFGQSNAAWCCCQSPAKQPTAKPNGNIVIQMNVPPSQPPEAMPLKTEQVKGEALPASKLQQPPLAKVKTQVQPPLLPVDHSKRMPSPKVGKLHLVPETKQARVSPSTLLPGPGSGSQLQVKSSLAVLSSGGIDNLDASVSLNPPSRVNPSPVLRFPLTKYHVNYVFAPRRPFKTVRCPSESKPSNFSTPIPLPSYKVPNMRQDPYAYRLNPLLAKDSPQTSSSSESLHSHKKSPFKIVMRKKV